ncbi:MAG: spore coat U domain-containing protein [Rhizobiaceae bacterium]|nr:spore coat U domain-containing protein [Rhizobiaceae bacterium]
MRLLVLLMIAWISLPTAGHAASCSVTIDDLDFGTVDSLGSLASDTVGQAMIDCSSITPGTSVVTVCLHIGHGTAGSGNGVRYLAAGSLNLAFQLYSDSGRSVVLGSLDQPTIGRPRKVTIAVSGDAASATVQVYGRVLGAQSTATSGRYASVFSGADASVTNAEGDVQDCESATDAASSSSFTVSATVPDNCLISVSDIEFGQHAGVRQNIDRNGNIDVTCTPGTEYVVTLNGGLSNSNDPERRILRSGADEALYGLYRDAARTLPWGNSLDTRLPGTGEGSLQSVTVYGRVPAQTLRPGTYSDTVNVTITYDALD